MTVSILIITHGKIGKTLLSTVRNTLGEIPLHTKTVAIKRNADPDHLIPKLRKLSHDIDDGDGVLILTDMFGSTPSNISQALKEDPSIEVVAGLNLPMLIRVMNYPMLNLAELVEKAYSGGREGVLNCCKDDDDHDHS